MRFATYGRVIAPMYVANGSNVQVQPQGFYVPMGAGGQYQNHFTLLNHRATPGFNPSSMGVVDKELGFLARAAAASATMMQEKTASMPVMDAGCAKAGNHAGGSFTEMIRGITRLPTAADVQSLMQVRASPTAIIGHPAAATASSSMGVRGSPSSSRESQQQKSDFSPLSPNVVHNWGTRSPSRVDADQVCENEAKLVTLSLLPNLPSKICSAGMATSQVGSSVVQDTSTSTPRKLELPLVETTSSGLYNPEASWCHQTSSLPETTALLASWYDPPSVELGKGIGFPNPDARLSVKCPQLTTTAKGSMDGFVVPSLSSPIMQVAASQAIADGAFIDQSYLEQVYGGSEEPSLLMDANSQVLWFNKPYERATKSANERLSGKTLPTGPYIDPLGHPTPLGSFLFHVNGKAVKATLWGFLKKLVIQESNFPVEKSVPGKVSHAHLNTGEGSQIISPPDSEFISRMNTMVGAGNSHMITLTLESITELHMEAPNVPETVEAVVERVGQGNDPAFITDRSNRVKWGNSALQQMFADMAPDAASSQLSGLCSKAPDASVSAAPGMPSFVMCCTERVPCSAWAFSCRINLEWMKGGRRRSMTVPCDVARLSCSTRATEDSWLWQFDMALSLHLHVP
ncbi:hypothetical protein KP509_23G029500 [Ceratopteris richardii]|nr:hypothetical protein KP509_23G029500 [Ceratopteris richardii]